MEETNAERGRHLSAKELLRNKGICYKAWNEWEESSRTLPKVGANKQFEPSGSWLENKQIEKGLTSREFLLGIERVGRLSQLSSAEWLPDQKKAKIIKKSGNEWTNFGHEMNGNLYLTPEEALILLETECLELIWNEIPLSIQQAYEILVQSEDSNCSINEYRVYSQLTRLGYHLQRFHYETSLQRASASDETMQRKKVIVDPENGLWMAGQSSESLATVGNSQKTASDANKNEKDVTISINGNSKNTNPVNETLSADANGEKSAEKKLKNLRVEIISEQTILPPIKIVKDALPNSENSPPKWPGTRIQRNVKLLPKRNDKVSLPAANAESSAATAQYNSDTSERMIEKRKRIPLAADAVAAKKSKHQVIELSDDEIEEIPRAMSRMEMLNCLPNMAEKTFITENIQSRYIPSGVTPHPTYRYDTRKLRSLPEKDRRLKENSDSRKSEGNRNDNVNELSNQRNAIVPFSPEHSRFTSQVRHNHQRLQFQNIRPFAQSFHELSNSIFMNMAGIGMQQMAVGRDAIWQNQFNRWPPYQSNMLRNLISVGCAMKNLFMQNMLQMNFHQNLSFGNQQSYNRPHRYLSNKSSQGSSSQQRSAIEQSSSRSARPPHEERGDEINKGTFQKFSEASSWTELKQKWRESKTITIDDEEGSKLDDPEEIQVLDQTVKPLANSKNCRNISEIYERLRIIKSAPNKTVRRKKSHLKISYNIFSNTQPYRKSNPGLPMFHLVVISHRENDFLQPVEINRLQQDGKGAPIMFALVSSSSIAYIQSGIVNLPNLP